MFCTNSTRASDRELREKLFSRNISFCDMSNVCRSDDARVLVHTKFRPFLLLTFVVWGFIRTLLLVSKPCSSSANSKEKSSLYNIAFADL